MRNICIPFAALLFTGCVTMQADTPLSVCDIHDDLGTYADRVITLKGWRPAEVGAVWGFDCGQDALVPLPRAIDESVDRSAFNEALIRAGGYKVVSFTAIGTIKPQDVNGRRVYYFVVSEFLEASTIPHPHLCKDSDHPGCEPY